MKIICSSFGHRKSFCPYCCTEGFQNFLATCPVTFSHYQWDILSVILPGETGASLKGNSIFDGSWQNRTLVRNFQLPKKSTQFENGIEKIRCFHKAAQLPFYWGYTGYNHGLDSLIMKPDFREKFLMLGIILQLPIFNRKQYETIRPHS